MSNIAPGPAPTASEPDDQDSLSQIWLEVFARSGSLSGFCLEWLLDRAEFDRADFRNGHSS
ncbi:hypothetical protein [Phaeobacter gallaeciensis]|jgi:hypothetical protein|uniref:hypothetical protein n=1 Tax=Phaeobacter gallaeciensis TaxID=60890 RepID=UPI00237F7D6F|nr:hypothetical protein [Phaeobacter gallaeciensis]MDE4152547.1 hypothetical protein [Phaeobacter gallaeciensis]MDE4204178.1 hypothetical protein [Phaeobacter gallaeciensis]MDE4237507.1 hypothetical protein [Phaeobacter gallaeciensis]MDE4257011.1 hypothetical protein [Phaeobacter gallaeciensis]MDE4273273.1 hypothetical protein [Phaeobacter gallaeciensis]